MPTDFSKYIAAFLSDYLPGLRNVSKNTISSYCDTFRLLLKFCIDKYELYPENITIKTIDVELIKSFLNWLEHERNSSISTRNQRLAAIRSFSRYIQMECPENMFHYQKIIDIVFKKSPKPIINYLTADELKLLFEQPNLSIKRGRRDLVLLCVLYDTGARVQEIVDLTVKDIRLEYPSKIRLTGKGRKTREVPLLSKTAKLLEKYIIENELNSSHVYEMPLFYNCYNRKLTRAGISYILNKYVEGAKIHLNSSNVTPHILRHTKAMHLLQAGVNLVYIRDILGHVDIKTTEGYARADIEMKRIALEKISTLDQPSVPSWKEDTDLLSWLKNYGKIKE